MPIKLVVVIVNYCCAGEILSRLPETSKRVANLDSAEIWIVDNKSPDDSITHLHAGVEDLPHKHLIKILSSSMNGGFGYGNNIAINAALAQETPPEYFYFLNPDAKPKPGALEAFLSFMDTNPKVGIAGGLLCNEEGTIETSLFRFPSFLGEVESSISLGVVSKALSNYNLVLETPTQPKAVDWVAGTSFIARSSALQKAGTFDENFFLYWEEIELCYRVIKSGYDVYAIPGAIVEHTGGVSTGMHNPLKRIPDYWFASRSYFFEKTGLVKNMFLLNITVTLCLIIWRTHQALRGRQLDNPHYVRDFISYNFLSKKTGNL